MSDFTNNLFHKIIHNEIPSYKLYEDDDFLVILDKYPAHPGHCLILPKIPARDVFELDDRMAAGLYPLAKRVAIAVQAATGCEGINILQNNGPAAGQMIFYFHLHIIPRVAGDCITIKHESLYSPLDDEIAVQLQSKIAVQL